MAKKRILLIDHRPEHMRQPVLRLQLEGYVVDEAHDGGTGLEKLKEGKYHLLLLDANPHTAEANLGPTPSFPAPTTGGRRSARSALRTS